jgi:hypothetical protein
MVSEAAAEAGTTDEAGPRDNELVIALPGDHYHLKAPLSTRSFTVLATGPYAQLDKLGASLAGTFTLDLEMGLETLVDIDGIFWRQSAPLGVTLEWAEGDVPQIEVEKYEDLTLTLAPEHVVVDATALDEHFELDEVPATFATSSVTITGPGSVIAELESGELAFRLEDIVLLAEDRNDRVELLRLHEDLLLRGCSLLDSLPIEAVVAINPARQVLTGIECEVALLAFNPKDTARVGNWKIRSSSLMARFDIVTRGLLPTNGAGSPVYLTEEQAIRNYVKDNIQAFVDIAGQPETGADTGVPIPIGWRLEDPEWRAALGKEDPRFDRASLKLVLVDNRDVFLDRK